AECSGGPVFPRLLHHALHFGRRGHPLRRGCPGASHRLHGNGLLDAVPVLGQLRQPGALEVLHQPQMPRSHHHCGLLGRHAGLHAAGGAELLRGRGARPERLHQRHQEQEGPHGGRGPAPVRVSRSAGTGHLHRSDRHFFRKTLPGLALFLVLHYWLGGHHFGFCSRCFPAVCLPEDDSRTRSCKQPRQLNQKRNAS
ncbi:unnamed protein product, partial [Tetraodon nigroviridis]